MTRKRIGVDAAGANAKELVAHIQELESIGIEATWLTTGGAGLDALSVFAAAGAQTQRILMATGITPTWPRHPVAAIQQVQVIAQLAPGRFRFGVGPSSRDGMEDMFGADFRAPVTNVKEYVQVCKSLLQDGSVDFQGTQYTARAEIEPIPDVPIMASALGRGAFKACGQVADGAISWLCPAQYLSDVAVPALEEGAREAGRSTPPLVAHLCAAVHEDVEEVWAVVKDQFSFFPPSIYYARMFAAAGFPEALDTGQWSDGMLDAVVAAGDEGAAEKKLRQYLDCGATEILVSIFEVGPDGKASRRRTEALLAEMTKSLN